MAQVGDVGQKRKRLDDESGAPDSKQMKLATAKNLRASKILGLAHWDILYNFIDDPPYFFWEPTKYWLKSIICGYLTFLFEKLEGKASSTENTELVEFYLSQLGPTYLAQELANFTKVLESDEESWKGLEEALELFPELFPTKDSFLIVVQFIRYLSELLCRLALKLIPEAASNTVVTISLFKKAIKGESGEFFKYPVELDDWYYCIPSSFRLDTNKKQKDLIYWWKKAEKRNGIINCWLKGHKGHLIWNLLHARPLVHLGYTECPYEYIYSENFEAIVSVKDGNEKEHILYISVNEGDADANTGIFGRVSSEEGVWMLFHGSKAGDCGTLVESTPVAIKSFYPRKEYETVPLSLAFSDENKFSRKHQVESVVFYIACLLLKSKKMMFDSYLPIRFKRSLLLSLLVVIHKKAKEEASQEEGVNFSALPIELLHLVVSFCDPPELPLLEEKQLKRLGSLNDEELNNLLIKKEKTVIPTFKYEDNVQMYEAAQSKDTSKEIAQLATPDSELLYCF